MNASNFTCDLRFDNNTGTFASCDITEVFKQSLRLRGRENPSTVSIYLENTTDFHVQLDRFQILELNSRLHVYGQDNAVLNRCAESFGWSYVVIVVSLFYLLDSIVQSNTGTSHARN